MNNEAPERPKVKTARYFLHFVEPVKRKHIADAITELEARLKGSEDANRFLKSERDELRRQLEEARNV